MGEEHTPLSGRRAGQAEVFHHFWREPLPVPGSSPPPHLSIPVCRGSRGEALAARGSPWVEGPRRRPPDAHARGMWLVDPPELRAGAAGHGDTGAHRTLGGAAGTRTERSPQRPGRRQGAPSPRPRALARPRHRHLCHVCLSPSLTSPPVSCVPVPRVPVSLILVSLPLPPGSHVCVPVSCHCHLCPAIATCALLSMFPMSSGPFPLCPWAPVP